MWTQDQGKAYKARIIESRKKSLRSVPQCYLVQMSKLMCTKIGQIRQKSSFKRV